MGLKNGVSKQNHSKSDSFLDIALRTYATTYYQIWRKKPDYLILHIGTNDATDPSNQQIMNDT